MRALGPDEAYARLLRSGTKPHFIGYYVLVMGLQGRPWNDCKGDEKKALRARFDAIKSSSFDVGLSEFEHALNEIGVIDKRILCCHARCAVPSWTCPEAIDPGGAYLL